MEQEQNSVAARLLFPLAVTQLGPWQSMDRPLFGPQSSIVSPTPSPTFQFQIFFSFSFFFPHPPGPHRRPALPSQVHSTTGTHGSLGGYGGRGAGISEEWGRRMEEDARLCTPEASVHVPVYRRGPQQGSRRPGLALRRRLRDRRRRPLPWRHG